MKKIALCLVLLSGTIFSCKNQKKNQAEDNTTKVEQTEPTNSEEKATTEKAAKAEESKKAPVVEKKKPVAKKKKPVVKKEKVVAVEKKEAPAVSEKKTVHTITVNKGTEITLNSAAVVDTKDLEKGQTVALNIQKDVKINDNVVITRGSKATAIVKDIQKEKKMSGVSTLDLELTEIFVQGKKYTAASEPLHFQGKNRTANTAIKTGIGAGVGAAVGALVSKKSGQGAAIGAAIGAVAGGATNAIAKKKSLILDEHTEMVFVLSKELKFEFDEKY